MRGPGVFEGLARLRPDLMVMAFVTDIVPQSILACPRLGTIQYHPSLLPRHRGGSAINWAIISGETKTGLTIFWPDTGIDTGPILLQREVDITPDDTLGSLYFGKLFPTGVQALLEAVTLVREGKAPRILQDESQATYEKRCEESDAIVDWSQPVSRVYNLIRGSNPQPGATTYRSGQKLKLYDAQKREGVPGGVPGEVVTVGEQGFEVAAPGGLILVKRVQPQGSDKMSAAEYVRSAGLKVGEKLSGKFTPQAGGGKRAQC
ncbi:MAG: methionyl-tRNA formyltransferase [Chloroflexi bacterium]|nr:methionyl-tRNA formyltransferase [Chloroflexota bacterium]